MRKKIFSVIFIVTLINLFGKGLGFLREMFIAKQYGASKETDIFYLTTSIPELIYVAIGLSITSGFIPIYLKWKEEKSIVDAKRLYESISTYLFFISTIIIIILYIFAPVIVKMVAPGFTADQHATMVKLLYVLIPTLYFYVFSGLSIGLLNAEKRFILPSLTSVVHNVSMIAAIILLVPFYGLYGLAIGFSVGVFLQFLLQAPPVFKKGVKLTIEFKRHKEDVKKIFWDVLPIIAASMIVQLNLFADKFVASFLDSGSVSAMNYANKIIYLPISIFIFTMITIFYTNLVEASRRTKQEYKQVANKYTAIILFITIPIAIFMMVFPEWIVRTFYGRGEFGEEDIALTASVLFWYALAFIFFSLKDFLMKASMANGNNKQIVIFNSIGVVLNICLSFLLGFKMGAPGIALASAIAMFVQTAVNFFYIQKTK